jgi:uncharacterized protein (TIGR03435 family)
MILQAIHPILEALGWALLHFIWQGALLALLLLVFQTLARRASATLRYTAGCIVMSLMVAVFAATVFQHFPTTPTPVIRNPLTAAVPLSPMKPRNASPVLAPSLPMRGLPTGPPDWIACLWLLGVTALSLFTACGFARVQKLRWHGLQPVELAWIETLHSLQRRLGVSRIVRLYTSALAETPAVIGWLKPYILLPLTALTGLSDSQLRAILAHELAHIRRHDYLVNLLQTAVETLLFYHPAVWWVGRQIRQEREHCCDDIAVAVCGDPVAYAAALAEMETLRARIPESTLPEPALAANGGDLLTRIRRLLGEQDHASRSLGTIAATALALLIAGVPALLAQETKPTFEAATIKPNTGSDPGNFFRMVGVTPSMTNQTMKSMLLWAYRVHDFQIAGGPGWISSDRWDIEAKTTAAATLEERQLMVQSLLHDRFKLALHREIKELPIYNLTVAKGGLKIQPNKEGSCLSPDPKSPGPAPGKTFMDYCGTSGFGRCSMIGSSATMTELAESLSNPTAVGRTVVNQTGVEGRFRYNVNYAPELTATPEPGAPPPACGDAPSIFTAIQDQLGLKLDSAKGPVEVLVIDRAEKPSEN